MQHEHTKRQTSAKVIKGSWVGEKEACCCFKMKKKVWEEKPVFWSGHSKRQSNLNNFVSRKPSYEGFTAKRDNLFQ